MVVCLQTTVPFKPKITPTKLANDYIQTKPTTALAKVSTSK